MANVRLGNFGPRAILLILAVVLFVLAALGFDVGAVSLTELGLAAFAGAFLVGEL